MVASDLPRGGSEAAQPMMSASCCCHVGHAGTTFSSLVAVDVWAVSLQDARHSSSSHSDWHLLLLCGGRDVHGTPLADAYGFARHRDGAMGVARGTWQYAIRALISMEQCLWASRLHISGGAVGGGRMVVSSVRCMLWCWPAAQMDSSASNTK